MIYSTYNLTYNFILSRAMENQLSFGADCVLTLDDIGEIKDYTETVERLINRINKGSLQIEPPFINELFEVMEADPEDTFFLPAFPQLLKLLLEVQWGNLSLKNQQLAKIFKFELLVIEECLLSMTFGQDLLSGFVKKCSRYLKFESFQRTLLWLLFKLSDKVVFIEEYSSVAILWTYIEEEVVLKGESSDQIDVNAAIYLQCCQKFTRSRKMRAEFQKKVGDKCILKVKLSLYNKGNQTISDCKKILEQKQYYGSRLLKDMVECWRTKLDQ